MPVHRIICESGEVAGYLHTANSPAGHALIESISTIAGIRLKEAHGAGENYPHNPRAWNLKFKEAA